MTQTDVRPWPGDNDHEGNTYPAVPLETDATPGPLDEIKTGIKAMFDFSLSIGNSVDEMTASTRKLIDRLNRFTPVIYRLGVSGAYPSSGVLVLSFGSPDQGTMWDIENVTIGGTDQNVTAAGSAGLYVSAVLPPPGSAAPAGITAMVDQAKTLPNTGFYGRRDIIVNDQEYFFLVIFGGTATQTYAGNMSASVIPTDAGRGRDVNEI
jgi:hypothetical protein